jgi:predicted nucleotidyltransferase
MPRPRRIPCFSLITTPAGVDPRSFRTVEGEPDASLAGVRCNHEAILELPSVAVIDQIDARIRVPESNFCVGRNIPATGDFCCTLANAWSANRCLTSANDPPDNSSMERDRILATLRAHENEFRSRGIQSLSLFGSLARGDNRPDSDIDVAVRLGGEFSAGGFDYFSCLENLEAQLSRLLGCKVDLVEEPVRKPRLQQEIDRNRAIAF